MQKAKKNENFILQKLLKINEDTKRLICSYLYKDSILNIFYVYKIL